MSDSGFDIESLRLVVPVLKHLDVLDTAGRVGWRGPVKTFAPPTDEWRAPAAAESLGWPSAHAWAKGRCRKMRCRESANAGFWATPLVVPCSTNGQSPIISSTWSQRSPKREASHSKNVQARKPFLHKVADAVPRFFRMPPSSTFATPWRSTVACESGV